jgi:cell wall-associated NlpC family hydrolase
LSDALTPFAGRLIPARPDLAAAHLQGRVAAERFVPGAPRWVAANLLDLFARPGAKGLATQLLHGERFTVYEERTDGLSWGQAALDGYVGYVATSGLGPARTAGQVVTARASHVYPAPDIKTVPVRALPFLARVDVAGSTGGFARLRGGGHVPLAHLGPPASDFVAAAEGLIGAPYLWGGRSAAGLDCSALVQLALMATGRSAPRDSDMQAALLGDPLDARRRLRRGDLVFWKGHVGIMTDAETLLHANAHHMAVVREPFAPAAARILAAGGGPVTARRRLPPDWPGWQPPV